MINEGEIKTWLCAIVHDHPELNVYQQLEQQSSLKTRLDLARRFKNNSGVEIVEVIADDPMSGLRTFPELTYFCVNSKARSERLIARAQEISYLESVVHY